MAQPAKRHTVSRVVVMSNAPRYDMRSVHSAVTVDSQHTDTAKCAAVIVQSHDCPAESLVTNIELV